MANIIADINQKGGVGKTTIAINLAAALGRSGAPVLVIDLDPQGHLTEGVGLKELYEVEGPSLYQGLLTPGVSLGDLVKSTPHDVFDLIPSHYQMMLAESSLVNARGRENRLTNLLEGLGDLYEWVIIDSPPNLGVLTDNAIAASRQLIVPVQAEQTSVRAMELLSDQIAAIEQELKFKVEILAVVPNLVQDSRLARRILGDIRTFLPMTIDFEFPKRVVLQEAYDQGRSMFTYEPTDRSKKQDAAELQELYIRLATIIEEKVKA